MTSTSEHALAFAMAALAPAVATGLFFLAWGIGSPGYTAFLEGQLTIAIFAFVLALLVAGIHVALFAVPLHKLLSEGGTAPGWATVLIAATAIGAVPIPILFQGGIHALFVFGLAGLIGGIAFLLASPGDGEAS